MASASAMSNLIMGWHEGCEAHSNNDIEEAIRCWNDVDLPNANILYNLGKVSLERGDANGAIEYLNKSMEKDKMSAVGHFTRGVAHYHSNSWEKAADDFEKSLTLLRGNVMIDLKQLGMNHKLCVCEVYLNIALSYKQLGNRDQAEEYFTLASDEGLHLNDDHINLKSDKIRQQKLCQVEKGAHFAPPKNKVAALKKKNWVKKSEVKAMMNESTAELGFTGETMLSEKQAKAKKKAGPPPRPAAVGENKPTHEAIYDYDVSYDEDLELRVGDQITLKLDNQDGWYTGYSHRTKKIGVFPSDFVKILEISPPSTPQTEREAAKIAKKEAKDEIAELERQAKEALANIEKQFKEAKALAMQQAKDAIQQAKDAKTTSKAGKKEPKRSIAIDIPTIPLSTTSTSSSPAISPSPSPKSSTMSVSSSSSSTSSSSKQISKPPPAKLPTMLGGMDLSTFKSVIKQQTSPTSRRASMSTAATLKLKPKRESAPAVLRPPSPKLPKSPPPTKVATKPPRMSAPSLRPPPSSKPSPPSLPSSKPPPILPSSKPPPILSSTSESKSTATTSSTTTSTSKSQKPPPARNAPKLDPPKRSAPKLDDTAQSNEECSTKGGAFGVSLRKPSISKTKPALPSTRKPMVSPPSSSASSMHSPRATTFSGLKSGSNVTATSKLGKDISFLSELKGKSSTASSVSNKSRHFSQNGGTSDNNTNNNNSNNNNTPSTAGIFGVKLRTTSTS